MLHGITVILSLLTEPGSSVKSLSQSKGIVLDEHEFQEVKRNVPEPCSAATK